MMPSGFKRYLTYLAVAIGIIYLSISIYFYNIQERMLFPARTIPMSQSLGFSIPYEELFLTTDDSAILNGVYFSAENPVGVIIYFHGNRELITNMQSVARPFVQRGYDFLAMDYRTYGKSTGELSEENLHRDATLFWEYLKDQGWTESEIIIYGRSIGTGIATDLASRSNAKGLLLYSPYSSIHSLASEQFSFLPVNLILRYSLDSYAKMHSVKAPVLILHGDKDRVIPVGEAQRLAEVKGKLVIIEGGGHNGLQRSPLFWQAIDAFLLALAW